MGTLDNATEMLSWNKEGKYFLELSDQKKNLGVISDGSGTRNLGFGF